MLRSSLGIATPNAGADSPQAHADGEPKRNISAAKKQQSVAGPVVIDHRQDAVSCEVVVHDISKGSARKVKAQKQTASTSPGGECVVVDTRPASKASTAPQRRKNPRQGHTPYRPGWLPLPSHFAHSIKQCRLVVYCS
eukprot:m.62805 g.62805  ORF g.62805 m.62805 type:complete len:138 (-) comp15815_c0_seq2:135-548(-)